MRQEGEPSVEDILASIKKVIASDQRTASPARSARAQPAEPASTEEVEEVLDLGEAGEFIEETPSESLIGDAAVDSMRESLAALAMMSEPRAKPQIVRQGETSIESLVREMLRPMLSQWLDDNLPGMVERLVTEEIRRIAGKKD
ncbi:DUF2497 domain-containing protein [Pseudoblastomonas halimionae]|uniref:DUF2497 domain-containing protein n=1 Tax=Alteriqipengyuania halimionae TaxID=1926630 RepID=A0A6I4U7M7_9SPHN|nr:DUF2497 domain-containing protein [Alteriqipengyuania halimionae]MXP10825.1 DUF2497 domain-containing protein [Alteriqipengyuania halimionae]